jgi:uncharacterized protein GlcG (DUF336 family)
MSVSIDQANAMIAAGATHAAKLGVAANIAVLDAAAHLKAFARMARSTCRSVRRARRRCSRSAARRSGITASPARRLPILKPAMAA